ncbi:hypothetical protein CALVIDRAFT_566221 [Calocera viscosa TUFC12733]|uniref:Protein CPL1-like domain-containing protein n=1 Tax=Calocera viscosa (strain TUFC12733) TaxID=1330018 RepID=A0A167JN84_CALVF|nr:hypothetical protein CALVIDRAFT_566221 [Calocera viscosa TUFC12733]
MFSLRKLVSFVTVALVGTSGAMGAALHPKMVSTAVQPRVLEKRGDICAEVNLSAAVDVLSILTLDVSPLKICLCLSGLDAFLNVDANAAVSALVSILGSLVDVQAFLTAQINSNGRQCSYPALATPFCSPSNPCDFTCPQGYTKKHGKCVLNTSKRAARRDIGRCSAGFTKCGAPSGANAYECIDVRSSLESCGGCVIPFPGMRPTGQDCTQIPGVDDVACIQGTCRVSRCAEGFALSVDGRTCIAEQPSVQLVLGA